MQIRLVPRNRMEELLIQWSQARFDRALVGDKMELVCVGFALHWSSTKKREAKSFQMKEKVDQKIFKSVP